MASRNPSATSAQPNHSDPPLSSVPVVDAAPHKRKTHSEQDEAKHSAEEAHDQPESGQASSSSAQSKRAKTKQSHDHLNFAAAAATGSGASSLFASTPAIRSAMLHHLSLDSGALFALLDWLHLGDIADLNSTCRTWRSWTAPPSACLPRVRAVEPSRFARLMGCEWARNKIRTLELRAELDRGSSRLIRAMLESSLLALVCFPVLETLVIHLRVQYVRDSVLRSCFSVLGPRLTALELALLPVRPVSEDDDAALRALFLQSLMVEVVRLPLLEILWIEGVDAGEIDLQTLSFAALPQLSALGEFGMELKHGKFFATEEQSRCLAECKHLRLLHCGQWDANPDLLHPITPLAEVDEAALLATRIGVIVNAVEQRLRDSSASHRFTLELCNTHVTPALWAYLCRIPCCNRLWPASFSYLSPVEWSGLAKFTALRALNLVPSRSSASSNEVEDFLPSLSQCRRLKSLRLGLITLRSSQLEQLCIALTRLHQLTCHRVRFESLLPLASAPRLRDLTFDQCAPMDDGPLLVRANLPAMPLLEDLGIEENFSSRERVEPSSGDHAPLLIVALLARCPMLRRERIRESRIRTSTE